MPRDERPKSVRATRRTFLRACALSGAAAGLPALGCSGAQDLPHGERPLAVEAATPGAEPAAPFPRPAAAPAPSPTPSLAALRDFAIPDGLETATVFLAALGDR